MNIKKMSGSLAVAVSLLALNGVATADEKSCLLVAADIETMATDLACVTHDDGARTWNDGGPIWKYKKNGDGCVVHDKVIKLLYTEREASTTDQPPWKGKVNKNGNNLAKGAAWAIADGQYQYAWDKLQEFMDTLMYSANAVNDGMQTVEEGLVSDAYGLQMRVDSECIATH